MRACKFKWAFNMKAALVIHLGADHAIVIEAKYDSAESASPLSGAERKIFHGEASSNSSDRQNYRNTCST